MPQGPLLIVDDEPGNLAAMRQILADDHALVFARNGSEALAAAAGRVPALILLDTDTGVHIWRMAAYARELAAALGWSSAAYEELERAAAMHDTGKIGIPGEILRKPGKLDPADRSGMRVRPPL